MKLIVGLGNPGERYANTRHNVGYKVVDKILEIAPEVKRGDYLFLKPKIYMNNSGREVVAIAKAEKISPENIWVINDDIDLPLGEIRVRLGGSSAGHKGLQSVINHLKSDSFPRFRVGIGRPGNVPPEAYVLQPFLSGELPVIDHAIDACAHLMVESLHSGIKEQSINLGGGENETTFTQS